MWTHRLPVHVCPAENAGFTVILGKFGTLQGRTESSAPTGSVFVVPIKQTQAIIGSLQRTASADAVRFFLPLFNSNIFSIFY